MRRVASGGICGGWYACILDRKPNGAQIRVKIKGIDCSKITNDNKRSIEDEAFTPHTLLGRARSGAVLGNDSKVTFVDSDVYGNKTNGSVAMIIPFDVPDDIVGIFTVDYTIASGPLKSGSLVDDWGNGLGPVPISDSGQTTSATVEVGPDGVGNVMMFAWVDTFAVFHELLDKLLHKV
ncbi:hypothetical protein TSTA_057870 [Talaromyces stipitatus ATCC 10500]|uniref:Uncharacterized protein n=1 Tax=Talaromyces stipitatus (strain ATCC 10500 / CBS 375.48 / QM 6759 / NRRL 1006) TaxID=441959 RepID=B8MRW4_TALSN|nr:uncharacterized protein TSTA_057870 [Talaromyces stipitatus ATCC 10500]EED13298.1 hypothetical protein TSTA_057870 [Talaromyces stipitatus ATCC 10500]